MWMYLWVFLVSLGTKNVCKKKYCYDYLPPLFENKKKHTSWLPRYVFSENIIAFFVSTEKKKLNHKNNIFLVLKI